MDAEIRRATRWAIGVSLGLTLLKLAVALWTGSLALLGSALDSGLDMIASAINAAFLHHAHTPADESHPFGHGKAEGVATLLQGLLIAGSGVGLLVEAIRRIVSGSRIQHGREGIVVLLVSVPVAVALGLYLRRVAKRRKSQALLADSSHYLSDVVSAGGALATLVLIQLGASTALDPIASVLIAGYILHTAWALARSAYDLLLDQAIPEAERIAVEVVDRYGFPAVGMHEFRARSAGPNRFVEFHAELDRQISFVDAHRVAEEIGTRIAERLGPGTEVLVHADPVDPSLSPEARRDPGVKVPAIL